MKILNKFQFIILPILSCLILFMALESFFWLNSKYEFIKKNKVRNRSYEKLNLIPALIQKEFDLRWPEVKDRRIPTIGKLDRRHQYYKAQRISDGKNIRGFRRFAPNTSFESKVTVMGSGENIYDVKMSVDENSRRIVNSSDNSSPKHLIFIGSSFTWGEGVSDKSIFSEVLQQRIKEHEIYISAMPGYGPNDNLELLMEDGWLFKGITQKKGHAVFFLIEDHFNRLLPTMKMAAKQPYRLVKSHFKLVGDKLVHDGYFSQKAAYQLAAVVGKSKLFDFFNIDFLFNTRKKRSQLCISVLLEMEKLLKTKFGTKELILVILNKGEDGKLVKKQWQKLGKFVFDYSRFDYKKATKGVHDFVLDTHPTDRVHWIYAKLLEKDLKSLGIK